jgi:hypothetical protein
MRTSIVIAVCLLFGAVSVSSSAAYTVPPKKRQHVNDPGWFGKCLLEYKEIGRADKTPGDICRRIQSRIAAKQQK